MDDVPESDQADIWLYTIATDRVSRLTEDGHKTRDQDPRFRSADLLTYVGASGAVHQLDLETRARRELFRASKGVTGIDWSPDSRAIAWTDGESIFIRQAADGSTRRLSLPSRDKDYGRGGGGDDEQLLEWSPDGSMILVQDTARCCPGGREETIHVVRLDGSIATAARGTFARWSPDSRSIYFRNLYASGDTPVQVLDVTTGKLHALGTIGKPYRLAPSPDGRYLAYDDGTSTPDTYLYELRGGTQRKVGPGLAPLWLSSDAVATTKTRPCREPETCGGHGGTPWRGVSRSILYSLAGDAPREIALASTWDARVA